MTGVGEGAFQTGAFLTNVGKRHFTEDFISRKHNRNHLDMQKYIHKSLLQEDKKFPFIYKVADNTISSLNCLNPVGVFI